MIYDYLFIKCVFRWSEYSVRFENLIGIGFRRAKFCEILSHSVKYGMYAPMHLDEFQSNFMTTIDKTI